MKAVYPYKKISNLLRKIKWEETCLQKYKNCAAYGMEYYGGEPYDKAHSDRIKNTYASLIGEQEQYIKELKEYRDKTFPINKP